MSDYTPTRQHVRAVWLDAYPDEFRGQGGAAFDRFIAALHAEWEGEQCRADAVTSMSAYDDGHTAGFTEGHAAALAEQGEVEWEYGAQHSQGTNPHPSRKRAEEMVAWHAAGDARKQPSARGKSKLVRRRKAGPWMPVPDTTGAES